MEGLGRLFNARVSTTTAALTAKLDKATAVTIFGISVGANAITLVQRTGPDGTGSSANLNLVKLGVSGAANTGFHYYTQTNGVWTKVYAGTSTPANAFTPASVTLLAIPIDAAMLDDGYSYVSASVSAGTFLYVTHDLSIRRAPALLADVTA